MGGDRAVTPGRIAQAQRWEAAGSRPGRARRHRLRLEERHPLADASGGGVRLQRRNLLAAAARLARGRRMAAPVAGAARSARTSGPHRLVQGVGGLGQHAGQKGGEKTGPNPVDRGRPGSKRHLLVDGNGTPLVALLTGAQVHDSKVFEELVDGVEPVKGPSGPPRKRPEKLHADKGYDYERCRRFLHRRGIKARIARRGVESSQRLGRPAPVGRRADAGLAILLPVAVRPLRTESRYPRGIPRTGLRPRVLQSLAKRVMKPSLNRRPPRTSTKTSESAWSSPSWRSLGSRRSATAW